MVQGTPYWNAKECARLQNKTINLHFPVESCHILLLFRMSDFVPCDLKVQKAY